jgi:hypothetical protein
MRSIELKHEHSDPQDEGKRENERPYAMLLPGTHRFLAHHVRIPRSRLEFHRKQPYNSLYREFVDSNHWPGNQIKTQFI